MFYMDVHFHRSRIIVVYKQLGNKCPIICLMSSAVRVFLARRNRETERVQVFVIIYASVRECRPAFFSDPAQQGLSEWEK